MSRLGLSGEASGREGLMECSQLLLFRVIISRTLLAFYADATADPDGFQLFIGAKVVHIASADAQNVGHLIRPQQNLGLKDAGVGDCRRLPDKERHQPLDDATVSAVFSSLKLSIFFHNLLSQGD